MAWVATTIDGDGNVTEYDNEFHGAKNGTYTFAYDDGDREYYVWVHDNVDGGITEEEAEAIADEAITRPIYWSDYRLCHWMYVFECEGHWIEGLFPNNGLHPDSEWTGRLLQVNVYE